MYFRVSFYLRRSLEETSTYNSIFPTAKTTPPPRSVAGGGAFEKKITEGKGTGTEHPNYCFGILKTPPGGDDQTLFDRKPRKPKKRVMRTSDGKIWVGKASVSKCGCVCIPTRGSFDVTDQYRSRDDQKWGDTFGGKEPWTRLLITGGADPVLRTPLITRPVTEVFPPSPVDNTIPSLQNIFF